MAELILLLQALLLVAGWILFLRAQTELKAQAARQSLTGEMEELRRSIDALLHRLTTEAAAIENRLHEKAQTLEKILKQVPLENYFDPKVDTGFAESETLEPSIEYNHFVGSQRLHSQVFTLAKQGMTAQEIAKQTGYAPGEVDLILRLQKNKTDQEDLE
jgi:DNA-binding transcriptional regulator GbsR (MarR family)